VVAVGGGEGNALAQKELADNYYVGRTVPQDDVEAVKWLRKAADQGNPPAVEALADAYMNGRAGLPKDFAKAARLMEQPAVAGNAEVQARLTLLYPRGLGAKGLHEGIRIRFPFRQRRQCSRPTPVGRAVSRGEGVEKDLIEGYKWLLVAEQHHNDNGAEAARVRLLASEALTPAQIAEAKRRASAVTPVAVPSGSKASANSRGSSSTIQTLIRDAESGSPEAQYRLGELFREGKAVPQDFKQAAKWYRQASDQGYTKAQYALGGASFMGSRHGQGRAAAIRLFEASGQQRFGRCAERSGHALSGCKEVSVDYPKALGWLNKAAAQRHPRAYYNLGRAYRDGKGVKWT